MSDIYPIFIEFYDYLVLSGIVGKKRKTQKLCLKNRERKRKNFENEKKERRERMNNVNSYYTFNIVSNLKVIHSSLLSKERERKRKKKEENFF